MGAPYRNGLRFSKETVHKDPLKAGLWEVTPRRGLGYDQCLAGAFASRLWSLRWMKGIGLSGTRWIFAGILLWAGLLATGCGAGGPRWTSGLAVMERVPRAQEMTAYPADGRKVDVNPPGFCWTPNEKAAQYRLEVRREGGSRGGFATEALSSAVYPPFHELEPGNYQWQVVYLDEKGTETGVSETRRFALPPSAPVLLMPDVQALKATLAGVHPRLYLTDGRLEKLKATIANGGVPSWARLRRAADAALEEDLYPEPPTLGSSAEDWMRTFTPGKVGSAHVARLALAYKLTGEAKYRDGARRWLLNLASWDPKGITSHALKLPSGGIGNDEASMPMLERMSLAWDWVGDTLEPGEREKVLASMTERGNQVLRTLEEEDFLTHPYGNHSGRAIAFLGTAGLAFLGDIPEAEQWLDYVLRAELTSYPSFGGDDGGWSQGLSYWSFYIYSHANFAVAMRQATETDLFKKPFFRNTGYLGLYFLPPYAPSGGFGDSAYHRPNESAGVLADTLAEANGDPVLKWYAKGIAEMGELNQTKWREWFVEDVYETLKAADGSTVRPETPAKLDGSKHMEDIGWVAMHSALGDAANDVWAMFRAGRFGSFSHAHADENSFQLYAYGQALAIDSGYYPSYGTPHDILWTRQTRAHNSVLVNGRGQPIFTWEADGKIEDYQRNGAITLVRGQAAKGYNLPQPAGTIRLWEKLLKEPPPPMEPEVESCERTLAFVGSATRPVLVVHDFVKTGGPATFDWLLHALNRMETDSRAGTITIRSGNARAAVRLAASAPFHFSQTNEFTVKPEAASNTAYILGKASFDNQWHLRATTNDATDEVKFLAVLVPYREGEPAPEIELVRGEESLGFRVAGTEAAAWWGKGSQGRISAGDITGEGRLVVNTNEAGQAARVVAK